MNTKEQTAKYICKNQERLQMALHVHEAMPEVRKQLIERVFEAVGEQVAKKLGLDVDTHVDLYKKGVYFRTEETEELWVYAYVTSRQKSPKLLLICGLHADEKLERKRFDEVLARFKTRGDLGTWSDGEIHQQLSDEHTEAFAYVHDKAGEVRWDDNSFLSRVIRNHDDVVSGVTERLVLIYEGMWAHGGISGADSPVCSDEASEN